jgi:hypothetical protein
VQPWELIAFRADTEALVHVGVLQAWQRVARANGDTLEMEDQVLGMSGVVSLVAVLGRVRDHIEETVDWAWLASGTTSVALGEWSHGPVDVVAQGVFIHGDQVLGWDGRKARTVNAAVDTPESLLSFSRQADVVRVTQDQAWRHHLRAVNRVLARAVATGKVSIQRVARTAEASTVTGDETSQEQR